MSLNGRLFLCTKDQIDALIPLIEQWGPSESVHGRVLELMTSSEMALRLVISHYTLVFATHEMELLSQVFGRGSFQQWRLPSNLDLVVRRFNQLQFWIPTEVLLAPSQAKRVYVIRKFIKIAGFCRVHQDLLGFFAIVLGLSNPSVSRLSETWMKVSSKLRKQLAEYESCLNPTRNHRAYRLMVDKMKPPIIPFVPLILKDLTFIHEGNKTYYDGLVNFEKMHMVAQILRHFRYCKSRAFDLTSILNSRGALEAQEMVRNLKVIDNQRKLTQLSKRIQPHR